MSSEKTEQPTPRRIREARNQGDVAVSAAVTQAAAALVILGILPVATRSGVVALVQLIRQVAGGESVHVVNAALLTLSLCLPLLGAGALGALAAGSVQTGGLFSPARWLPNLASLNPVEGLKKLFDPQRLFQVLRAMVALVVACWLSWLLLSDHADAIAASVGEPRAALLLSGHLALRLLWFGLGATVLLAAVDWGITHHTWLRRHRMSPDEIKREHRESEGDPQVKQQRRRAYDELLQSATLGSVKDASVLIINPTHLAVALRYRTDEDDAPLVIAQGQDHQARQLIDAARAYGVPIVRDVPVARALWDLELGEEIPEVLYEAVAEILREVMPRDEGAPPAETAGLDR